MSQDKQHNKNGAGRKKVYDKGAHLMYETVKRAHRALLNSPLNKNERDPITQELTKIRVYLENRAFLPSDEVSSPAASKPAIVGSNANRDIIEQHAQVVNDLIVKGHSIDTIKKRLWEVSKQVIHHHSIAGYRNRFKETEEYRVEYERYVGSLDSMRIYTKVGRMEELTSLYEEAFLQHKLLKTRDSQNQVLKILDQARRESDSPAVYNFQMQQNNMQINGTAVFNLLSRETEKDLLKGLPIHEIVLGRIAAKTGTSPLLLMKRLHNSYYSKQAGMRGLASIKDDIEYPSEILYDIESMVGLNEKLAKEEEVWLETQPAQDAMDENPSEIKQKILDRLKQRKDGKNSNTN